MGIGGAAVMPSTLSIISNVFDPRERAKAIGVWAGAVGLGVAIGPVVGGLLLEHFWWGSVFLINVPIIVAGVVAVAVHGAGVARPEARAASTWSACGLSIVGLVALVYGIIDGGEHGFGRLAGVGRDRGRRARCWPAFICVRAAQRPPVAGRARCSATPRFSAAVGSVGLVFFAAMGTMFFLAFYLQLVRATRRCRPA